MPMPLNARLFVWFRLLFNCRFYYPVYTILFLDFGLNMSQFALLNVTWAISIVCMDLPLGALADVIGRRKMVIIAASIMVVEMIVFAAVPVGGPWVFYVFLVNRVLSGAAEAFASGADEALAYDSIPVADRAEVWPRVMGRLSRWMAIGFILAALVGAYVYDHESMSHLTGLTLTKETTLKFPIYLCAITALCALGVALSLQEAPHAGPAMGFRAKLSASWSGVKSAGSWIWRTPAPFLLLTLGFLLDSIVRLFYTVGSNYYRYIGIGEAYFGVISVGGSVLALMTSSWMEWLVRKCSAAFNFGLVIVMVAWGLLVLANPIHGWPGVLMLVPILLSMRFFQFFLSHYLNELTDSAHRATVLSFKSLSMNLAYGTLTLLFGWQTAYLSGHLGLKNEDPKVFAAALTWWPWWFAGTMVVYGVLRWVKSTAK
jgi:MFS family permease